MEVAPKTPHRKISPNPALQENTRTARRTWGVLREHAPSLRAVTGVGL